MSDRPTLFHRMAWILFAVVVNRIQKNYKRKGLISQSVCPPSVVFAKYPEFSEGPPSANPLPAEDPRRWQVSKSPSKNSRDTKSGNIQSRVVHLGRVREGTLTHRPRMKTTMTKISMRGICLHWHRTPFPGTARQGRCGVVQVFVNLVDGFPWEWLGVRNILFDVHIPWIPSKYRS